MKVVKLLHNPKAGDEQHTEEEIVELIEANGFHCRYSSTKTKDWKEIEPGIDFLVAAGGDGTVRKITKELLKKKKLEKTWPIALLPLGTANNIAKTLNITGEPEEIIQSWHKAHIRNYDVGRLHKVPKSKFFLEAFGYGIFPYLIQEMKKQEEDPQETPEDKMKASLKLLHQIILSYEPKYCKLEVDGTDYSGKYLMAEVMNIRSIGPNLFLSRDGDPGDGEMEVVLLPEKDKEQFASYMSNKMEGVEEPYSFTTIKAGHVRICWEGSHAHVDDEIVKMKEDREVEIEIKQGLLEFLVGDEEEDEE